MQEDRVDAPGTLQPDWDDIEQQKNYCDPNIEAGCPEREDCVKKFFKYVGKYCWRLK